MLNVHIKRKFMKGFYFMVYILWFFAKISKILYIKFKHFFDENIMDL